MRVARQRQRGAVAGKPFDATLESGLRLGFDLRIANLPELQGGDRPEHAGLWRSNALPIGATQLHRADARVSRIGYAEHRRPDIARTHCPVERAVPVTTDAGREEQGAQQVDLELREEPPILDLIRVERGELVGGVTADVRADAEPFAGQVGLVGSHGQCRVA